MPDHHWCVHRRILGKSWRRHCLLHVHGSDRMVAQRGCWLSKRKGATKNPKKFLMLHFFLGLFYLQVKESVRTCARVASGGSVLSHFSSKSSPNWQNLAAISSCCEHFASAIIIHWSSCLLFACNIISNIPVASIRHRLESTWHHSSQGLLPNSAA